MVKESFPVVMPVANAGFRLPGIRHDVIGHTALVIGHDCFRQLVRHAFDVQHRLHFAATRLEVVIVKIGADVHARPAQWRQVVVEIKQVGIVLIQQVADAVIKVADVRLVGIFVDAVFAAIKFLRVVALPPLALTIVQRQVAVVRHAHQRTGFVAQMGHLKPPPVAGRVNGHTKAEAAVAGRRRPTADDVPVRADVLSVPSVIF